MGKVVCYPLLCCQLMKIVLMLLVPVLFCACGAGSGPSVNSSAGGGPEFLPARAKKGDLFVYYDAKGLSKWRRNWASSLDLSGVSWNDARTATLIDPSYVVMAGHFVRPSSVAVMFHDRKGKAHERFISKVRKLSGVGDIAVAKLNRPLPPEVKAYRFATVGEATVGRPVIVTDKTKTLSVHRIDAVSGGQIRLGYMPELDPVYRRNLIVGDSGNPSFLLVRGELVLLETHTTGGAGAGPFYGAPKVQAAIRSAMAEMGD